MILTRTQRIHRGLNRIGLVVSLIIAILGGLFVFLADGTSSVGENPLPWVIGILIIATLAYVLCRVIGWIIAGFMGE